MTTRPVRRVTGLLVSVLLLGACAMVRPVAAAPAPADIGLAMPTMRVSPGVGSADPVPIPLVLRGGRPVGSVRVVREPARFRWPLDGPPRVVRRFDPPPRPWLAGHRGVDLAGGAGVPVRAAGDGVVLFAGSVAGRGVVSVTHAGGLRTTYEPLEPAVRAGDRVVAGDVVGTLRSGHSGCPGACLHWGLRRGDVYLDPLLLLGLGRMRLKPLAGVGVARRAVAGGLG